MRQHSGPKRKVRVTRKQAAADVGAAVKALGKQVGGANTPTPRPRLAGDTKAASEFQAAARHKTTRAYRGAVRDAYASNPSLAARKQRVKIAKKRHNRQDHAVLQRHAERQRATRAVTAYQKFLADTGKDWFSTGRVRSFSDRRALTDLEAKGLRIVRKRGLDIEIPGELSTRRQRGEVAMIGEGVAALARALGAELQRPQGLTDLPANAVRDVRDVVAGLPGVPAALLETGGEIVGHALVARGMDPQALPAGWRDGDATRSMVEGVEQSAPGRLVAAGTRALRGDTHGAGVALKQAEQAALTRPVSTALEAAGAGRAVSVGASIAKEGGMAGHRAAQLRPRQVERRPGDQPIEDRAGLDAARQRAREGQQAPADRVAGKPRRYSAGLAGRAVQQARENRQAAKGQDPLALTGRKLKRATLREQTIIRRNNKAAGLAAEERQLGLTRKTHDRLDEDRRVAVELQAMGTGRTAAELEQVLAAFRAHAKTSGSPLAADNVRKLERLARRPQLLNDPKVREAAHRERQALRQGDEQAAREGYIDPGDAAVARDRQPLIASGQVAHLKAGDKVTVQRPAPAKAQPRRDLEGLRQRSKKREDVKPTEQGGGGDPSTPPSPPPPRQGTVEAKRQAYRAAQARVVRLERAVAAKPDDLQLKAYLRRARRDLRTVTAQGKALAAEGRPAPKSAPRPKPDGDVGELQAELRDLSGQAASLREDLNQLGSIKRVRDANGRQRKVRQARTPQAQKRMSELRAKLNDVEAAEKAVMARLREHGASPEPGKERRAFELDADELREHAQGLTDAVANLDRQLAAKDAEIRQARKAKHDPRTGDDPRPAAVNRLKDEQAALQARRDQLAARADSAQAELDALPDQGVQARQQQRPARQRDTDAGQDQQPAQRNGQPEARAANGRPAAPQARVGDQQPRQARQGPGRQPQRQSQAPQDQGAGNDVVTRHDADPSVTTFTAARDGWYWVRGERAGTPARDLPRSSGEFVKGRKGERSDSRDPTKPQAREGYQAADVFERVLGERAPATRLEREQTLTMRRIVEQLEQRLAWREGDTVHFGAQRAQQLADQLTDSTGRTWAVLRAGDDERNLVVPKVVADRWKADIKTGEPGTIEASAQWVNRQFIRAVLPLSFAWHMGNVVDLYTRFVLTGDWHSNLTPKAQHELIGQLRAQMTDLDPALADRVLATLQGHFGSRQSIDRPTLRKALGSSRFGLIRDAGRAMSAVRELPGIKAVADTHRGAVDRAFRAGVKLEDVLVKAVAGRELQRQARGLGLAWSDHADLAGQMARRFEADPRLIEEFQARTLEITGDYVTRGPALRRAINSGAAPFLQWIKASNRFVFQTLPKDHPYGLALTMLAAQATAEQRAQLGLNYFHDADVAKALAGDGVRGEGYALQSIPAGDGRRVPVAPFTSFGAAAALLTDPVDYAKRIVAPAAAGPVEKTIKHGPEVGANAAVEATVPGARNVRRAREGNRRPHPRSTLWDPTTTSDTDRYGTPGVTSRVLGAAQAPALIEPYRDSDKKRQARLKPDAQGYLTIYTGSGKNRRAIRVKAKP